MLNTKLWKIWKNGTWNGIFLVVLLHSILQDWLGLDGYIEFCKRHWYFIPWWVWLIPLVLMGWSNWVHWRYLLQKEKVHIWADELLKTMAKAGAKIKDNPEVVYPKNN